MGRTAMSEREMRRATVLAQVKSGAWTLVQAAERLKLSYRQAKRLWKRYQKKGATGLVHGSAGRASNRAKAKKTATEGNASDRPEIFRRGWYAIRADAGG